MLGAPQKKDAVHYQHLFFFYIVFYIVFAIVFSNILFYDYTRLILFPIKQIAKCAQ